ncbi:MAG: glycosyltransferase family 2 protein [Armatimonadetes bacterium]|nr:glycosyltransferase family 2 protein [Armatimonadota bacterium]
MLTLALIVKDDAERLRRCLASVKDHVDRMVVLVDTLSTDASWEVAQEAGAQTYEVVWNDSWADARNQALERIPEGWVLWLDADEWFEEEQASKLRRLCAPNKDVVWLVRRDLGRQGNLESVHSLPRLWRTSDELRFVRRIHEHIPFPASARIRHSSVWFWHDGYGKDLQLKAARNVRPLRLSLEEDPEDVYSASKLASHLLDLGETEEAYAILDRLEERTRSHADEPRSPHPDFGSVFLALLQGAFQGRPITALTARLALRWYGNAPMIAWRVAELFAKLGRHDVACEALQILESNVRRKSVREDLPYHPDMVGVPLYLNLALSGHQAGRTDLARWAYGEVLARDPENAAARRNLAALRG